MPGYSPYMTSLMMLGAVYERYTNEPSKGSYEWYWHTNEDVEELWHYYFNENLSAKGTSVASHNSQCTAVKAWVSS